MGFILVEQTQTSVEHTKFSLLYFVEHNQTMLVEHNHTMPVEHTSVTLNTEFDTLWLSPGNFQSAGSILTNDTLAERGGPCPST